MKQSGATRHPIGGQAREARRRIEEAQANEGARLTILLPGEGFQGVRGIEGFWLTFERPQGDRPHEEGRPEGNGAGADTTAERRKRGAGR